MEKLRRLPTLSKGYYLVDAPKDFPGRKLVGLYAMEHRVIWWQHHGSLPPNGWHIHHLNGDPLDNRIENLKAITASDHAKQTGHFADLVPESFDILTCFYCKKEFQKLESSVRYWESKGQNNFFCCKSCQVSYQNQFKKGKKLNYPKNRKSSGKNGVNLKCQACDKEYYVPRYKEHTSKTCSLPCSYIYKSLQMRKD